MANREVRGRDEATRLAEAMLAFRRVRPDELPSGLFGETGWEYLLELFIADAHGERLTGRQICERAKASPSACSRWLLVLSREGLVVGDGNGELDDGLTLSGEGLSRMEQLLSEATALKALLVAQD